MKITSNLRFLYIVEDLAGRGFGHAVVILIIKTFIQDRAKLCLPHNTIAFFKGQ